MKTPKINSKKLAAALAPLALAGAVIAPAAAASAPPSAQAPAATAQVQVQVQDAPEPLNPKSRTFEIQNESNHTIELSHYTGDQQFDAPFPAMGSRVPPGGHADFTLKESTLSKDDWTTVWYMILDGSGNQVGTFEVFMVVPSLPWNGEGPPPIHWTTSYSACNTHGSPLGCTADPQPGVWDWAPAKPIVLTGKFR